MLVQLLSLPAAIYASFTQQPTPVTSLDTVGRKWVEQCVQRYPETVWLADERVRKTEEGHAVLQGPYSEQLFGQKFIEFDRTLMTIHCLKLLLEGSETAYQQFTAAQESGARLTRESFTELVQQGRELLASGYSGLTAVQMREAMETALVLGDLGKSEKARELFRSYGPSAPDHDDFYGEAMRVLEEHPHLCPSYARLSAPAQALLRECAKNGTHYGHVTHLEGGPLMFKGLVSNTPSPTALDFDLFVHTCDVAGALGHLNNHSSIVYTENTHRAMQAMAKSCRMLLDARNTSIDAYNAYVETRAGWLGLDPKNRQDCMLARVGAMLRLFTPEDGRLLRRSFSSLPVEVREKIASELDLQKGRTPTYMPAVLVNLSNNPQLGSTREERMGRAVEMGLPFLARVLERHQQNLLEGKADPFVPLNFNKMAGVAKNSPDLLAKDFTIDREGNVNARP